jgi:hypothetical protein
MPQLMWCKWPGQEVWSKRVRRRVGVELVKAMLLCLKLFLIAAPRSVVILLLLVLCYLLTLLFYNFRESYHYDAYVHFAWMSTRSGSFESLTYDPSYRIPA